MCSYGELGSEVVTWLDTLDFQVTFRIFFDSFGFAISLLTDTHLFWYALLHICIREIE